MELNLVRYAAARQWRVQSNGYTVAPVHLYRHISVHALLDLHIDCVFGWWYDNENEGIILQIFSERGSVSNGTLEPLP